MLDPSEFSLDKSQQPAPGIRRPRVPVPWVIGAAAVLAVGMVVWFFLSGREVQEPVAEPQSTIAAAPPPAAGPFALCEAADIEAVALPSLDDSDTLVNTLAGTLSAHPRVVAWLATDGLIRNFSVVVENIASGASPAVHLSALRPAGSFQATGEGLALVIDPRSYARYAPIAAAVDSVNAEAAARLCGALKPRLEEAYSELGRGGSFDSALEGAIVAMLETPALGANVRVAPDEAAYVFRDTALESLTPAQKHLARMGAANARLIQDKLRQIALAIGIPRTRLPE